MSTSSVLPIDEAAVQTISASKNEPEWMSKLRLEALELAGRLELPKLEKARLDRWNLASFGEYKKICPIGSLAELPRVACELLQDDTQAANLLIQHNSSVIFSKLAQELDRQGVIFTDLETAVQKHPELVQPYFMKAVEMGENRLTAIHAALWNGGVFLYVPKNVEVTIPLQAILYSDDPNASFAPHILIVAEANSKVTYVDNFVTAGAQGSVVQNGVVEVFAQQGAKVTFVSVHEMNEATTDLTYRRAILEQDARVEWVIGEMNGGDTMSDTVSILKGNGSSSDAKVICVGTGSQKMNITTRAVHFGKSTESDMITRAVMRDHATAIVNGITKIEKGATKSNGQQTEKVLMLSPKARGDANPILLIDEDDVKAGHAASVGQVNADYIYYLMSRGIPKSEAEKLIIYGFLAPVVSEVPIEKLEEQLKTRVERKLGQ